MYLNEGLLGDIILCDPVTSRGKKSLENLGLQNAITEDFFYNILRVKSKFDEDEEPEDRDIDELENGLFCQYTLEAEQFREMRSRLEDFEDSLTNDKSDSYPLLMLGVAGNGKSIEAIRKVFFERDRDDIFGCKIYLDLEGSPSKITKGGLTFQCRNPESALDVFYIKLLDYMVDFLQEHRDYASEICKNFCAEFEERNLKNESEVAFFGALKKYAPGLLNKLWKGKNDTEKEVFTLLDKLSSTGKVQEKIESLFEVLMLILFCLSPKKKHFIVIDNIEEYIKVDQSNVYILDSDISQIYKSIKLATGNIVRRFDSIQRGLAWESFKVVFVMRRTSLWFLDPSMLHCPFQHDRRMCDVTGYFHLPAIWVKKKKHIWEEMLSHDTDDKSRALIDILDTIMCDCDEKALGTTFQTLIAPLMSYGIRRNARAQAHCASVVYDILSAADDTLDYTSFESYSFKENAKNSAARYMFRRALLEIQFKWCIANKKRNRWASLGIGHIASQKKIKVGGHEVEVNETKYYSNQNVSMMRRILTCLSRFDDGDPRDNTHSTHFDMFSTIPLYELIRGVLVNPVNRPEILNDDYEAFARVLIALSDMSYDDTRSAPYVVLNIKDSQFHAKASFSELANLCKKIFEAGPEESLPDKKYNCAEFGARITNAGYAFLLDWQASFSFMASLYCFSIPPLFFLKNSGMIQYVIDTVYMNADNLCKKYESDAIRFLENRANLTLKEGGYLLSQGGKFITFREHVKMRHIQHLQLFKTYIKECYANLGMSENTVASLLEYISEYIEKYRTWRTDEGAKECF